VVDTSSARAHNNWWQVRSDVWSRLEETSGALANAILRGQPADLMVEATSGLLKALAPIEQYWAFPGPEAYRRVRDLFAAARYDRFARMVAGINRALVTEAYRIGSGWSVLSGEPEQAELDGVVVEQAVPVRPYFEVLVVETLTAGQERVLREEVRSWRRPDDEFVYELVVVSSGEEAAVAVSLNANLQACVIRRRFAHAAAHDLSGMPYFVDGPIADDLAGSTPHEYAQILASRLAGLRPELDLYLMTDIAVEDLAGHLSQHFRRVFHAREGSLELHLSILAGVAARYRAPFFEALRNYSRRPTGMFHALPVSQGKSIVNSHWINDMVGFYGLEVFLAETSATGGGLDSLLEPTGPLRQAQQLAAETFGARRTYFVTNGTSTANKIVVQALIAPGDIVLVDRNCHQSHHYGLMLSGALVTYLEAYPLNEYSIYGAVPLREIKSKLLAFRAAGKLDRVKMLLLTNCTFDGIVYNVERVMEECLAIKPDLVFLWDEAWFAFARFHPVYRPRTAMHAARTLAERLRLPEYRATYEQHAAQLADDDASLLTQRLLPDPARARVRVYSTQSTHKTLTSLRQGSMIHVHDQDFAEKGAASFYEAYMTHTSTSPNYQILASLDLGRRQASLEGFELVQKQLDYATRLRDAIDNHPLLAKYMHCLSTAELIPAEFRASGMDKPLRSGLDSMSAAWEQDEFVLDLSRISLYIGLTGIDGATFKCEQLMDKFGIQVNKTSRNTVLFMTNIGTTRSSLAYLIEVLVKIAREFDESIAEMSPTQQAAHARTVMKQTNPGSPLPDFSGFHPAFLDRGDHPTPEGDVRRAFFLSYDDTRCEYLLPDEIEQRILAGQHVVSATFVTPYPPGCPVLVPGQVFSREILSFMRSLDIPEIHGYNPQAGYRIYATEAVEIAGTESPLVGAARLNDHTALPISWSMARPHPGLFGSGRASRFTSRATTGCALTVLACSFTS
jgi:arginine/lysine/ornithine decarboxylase